jgi:hypothetical protein
VSGCGLEVDAAVVSFGDLADEGEPESAALVVGAGGVVPVALEDGVVAFGRDARPLVRDGDVREAVVLTGAGVDGCSRRRVAGRVVEQVGESAWQRDAVAGDAGRAIEERALGLLPLARRPRHQLRSRRVRHQSQLARSLHRPSELRVMPPAVPARARGIRPFGFSRARRKPTSR